MIQTEERCWAHFDDALMCLTSCEFFISGYSSVHNLLNILATIVELADYINNHMDANTIRAILGSGEWRKQLVRHEPMAYR